MTLNFTEIGELLHISGVGAKKRIMKYQEELSDFIVKNNNGVVIGFDDEGIEKLRNIGNRRRSFSNEKKDHELEILNIKNESLQNEIETLNKALDKLSDSNDQLLKRVEQLEAENKELRGRVRPFGWIGFKK